MGLFSEIFTPRQSLSLSSPDWLLTAVLILERVGQIRRDLFRENSMKGEIILLNILLKILSKIREIKSNQNYTIKLTKLEAEMVHSILSYPSLPSLPTGSEHSPSEDNELLVIG